MEASQLFQKSEIKKHIIQVSTHLIKATCNPLTTACISFLVNCKMKDLYCIVYLLPAYIFI